jgi:flotillin
MEKKAEAWQQYNEAAVLQLLAPILPEIAKAISEPLSRVDKITLVSTGGGNGHGDIGASRITGEMTQVMAQVPPLLESLTGLKLDQLLARLKSDKGEPPPEGTSGT